MSLPPLLRQAGELTLALAILAAATQLRTTPEPPAHSFWLMPVILVGGLTVMVIVGMAWGVIEDWQRERRWNRG